MRTNTTAQTGGRPTLGVIRSQPPRVYGAGVVLDPEEANRRTPTSTTTAAWNDPPIERGEVALAAEWVVECCTRWLGEEPLLSTAATARKNALWRAEHELYLAQRDYASVRVHITRPETRARYENRIAEARDVLARVEAARDWTPIPLSSVPTPFALDSDKEAGASIRPTPHGSGFTVGLLGRACGVTLVSGAIAAHDPELVAEIAVAVRHACEAYEERHRTERISLC